MTQPSNPRCCSRCREWSTLAQVTAVYDRSGRTWLLCPQCIRHASTYRSRGGRTPVPRSEDPNLEHWVDLVLPLRGVPFIVGRGRPASVHYTMVPPGSMGRSLCSRLMHRGFKPLTFAEAVIKYQQLCSDCFAVYPVYPWEDALNYDEPAVPVWLTKEEATRAT